MYCTKCGRKLEDGEVCTCTQKAQVPHMQADLAQVKKPQVEQPGEKQFEEYVVKPEQTKTAQSRQEQTSQSEQAQTHAQAAGEQEAQKKNSRPEAAERICKLLEELTGNKENRIID